MQLLVGLIRAKEWGHVDQLLGLLDSQQQEIVPRRLAVLLMSAGAARNAPLCVPPPSPPPSPSPNPRFRPEFEPLPPAVPPSSSNPKNVGMHVLSCALKL